ncbi:hypothetical protein CVS40_11136 [Lucilia cuprina]|nr:hypothetical protein CVS40_11136 [Lucilia cuprina]
MSTIRRWDLTYDGGDNLTEFIERLEELAECYGFDRGRLLFSLLEILKNKALQWYRVKREQITTWDQFKEEATRFFLPRRYLSHLEENIYHRKQGLREKAKDYIMSLQALIRQHPELRKLNHTDRIYDGLRYEYKLYVRRNDFVTIDELMELTDEYELLRKEEAKQGKLQPNHYIDVSSTTGIYNRKTHCWHCKQIGHFRGLCPNQGRIFCSWCGQDGIMSRDCLCSREESLSDGRYYLSISIFGTYITALVDTGSTLTYLGKTVRQLLEAHNIRPRNHQRTIQLADGSCIPSVNVYPIAVEANGKTTHLLASSLDSLAEPVILGMDFLRRRKATLLIDGKELRASEPSRVSSLHAIHSIVERKSLDSEQNLQLQAVLNSS